MRTIFVWSAAAVDVALAERELRDTRATDLGMIAAMTWQDAMAGVSAVFSGFVFLVGALSRETIGELKRRVGVLEHHDETRAKEVAQLDERSKAVNATLHEIKAEMVPRKEWEARHAATDAMLERIITSIDSRFPPPLPEPAPPRRK
jgi:hypothetical protein